MKTSLLNDTKWRNAISIDVLYPCGVCEVRYINFRQVPRTSVKTMMIAAFKLVFSV